MTYFLATLIVAVGSLAFVWLTIQLGKVVDKICGHQWDDPKTDREILFVLGITGYLFLLIAFLFGSLIVGLISLVAGAL